MRILLINQDWLKDDLTSMGITAVSAGNAPHLDIVLNRPVISLPDLIELSGIDPTKIIIYDNSRPLYITHLEATDIPITYYCVDVHHHIWWQRYLSLYFDCVLSAQKEYLPQFLPTHIQLEWFPLWGWRDVQPSAKKSWDCIFVGTVDKTLNPERALFLEQLAKKIPLTVERGEYWNFFPKSRGVVNQSAKGELNFRTFEALYCGSPLVTEAMNGSLEELFVVGEELLTYKRGDADDAATKIQYLLDNPQEAIHIGLQGREAILRAHGSKHRAEILRRILEKTTKRTDSNPFSLVLNYVSLSVLLDSEAPGVSSLALDEAIRCCEYALNQDRMLSEELSIHVKKALDLFNQRSSSARGYKLEADLKKQYPGFF